MMRVYTYYLELVKNISMGWKGLRLDFKKDEIDKSIERKF